MPSRFTAEELSKLRSRFTDAVEFLAEMYRKDVDAIDFITNNELDFEDYDHAHEFMEHVFDRYLGKGPHKNQEED